MNNEFNHFDEQMNRKLKVTKTWNLEPFEVRNNIQVNDILKPNGCLFFFGLVRWHFVRIQLMKQCRSIQLKTRRPFTTNENLYKTRRVYLFSWNVKWNANETATRSIHLQHIPLSNCVWILIGGLGFCLSPAAIFESINLIGIKMAIIGFVMRSLCVCVCVCGQFNRKILYEMDP